MKGLFARKPIKSKFVEIDEEHHEGGMKRHLSSLSLISIGIGAIIGAGIFVITGQAAALYAGPAIVLSFIVAAIICVFAGLCFAELAAMIPVAGGSYAYSYASMGELPAWIVGWTLLAQFMISISTVAVGWGGYFTSFLHDWGVTLSETFTNSPIRYAAGSGWELSGSVINIPAMVIVALAGIAIAVGIKAAAHFNNVMVAIKLTTIVLFIIVGWGFINTENWTPFIPENKGVFGEFGWSGILRGAGLVFFAFIGFDTVSTLAQEAKDPQKDLPVGILGSLGICTIAYIIVSLILTGIASYVLLNVPEPMSIALDAMGPKFFWFTFIVKLAILAGLASVVLVQSLGLTRIFYAISKDGLLPKPFSKINQKSKSPLFATVVTALGCMIIAGFFSVEILGQLVSMATLFLFAIVCLVVLILRKRHPKERRPFKVPFVPVVPVLGIIACVAQMGFLPLVTWVQFACWLLLGLGIYFSYGIKYSKLRN
jgi:APA family basic amino acid/polyamine antiporter